MNFKETLIAIGKFITLAGTCFIVTTIVERIANYKVEGELQNNPDGLVGMIKHIAYWIIIQALVLFYCLHKLDDKLTDTECTIRNLEDKIKHLELEDKKQTYDIEQLKAKLKNTKNEE